MSDIVERLQAWGPLVISGYECPAAGTAMHQAADTIANLRATNERLRAALRRVTEECDALMELEDGKKPDELAGYSRGSYFTARHIKTLAQEPNNADSK